MNLSINTNTNFNGIGLKKFFNKKINDIKKPLSPRIIREKIAAGIQKRSDDFMKSNEADLYVEKLCIEEKVIIGLVMILLAGGLMYARRTEAIKNVMQHTSSLQEAKGLKNTTYYFIGKSGEPFDKAFQALCKLLHRQK